MENILSQEEVDALLKGVQSGEVETEPQNTDISGVRPYDLASQEKTIRGKMHGLEMVTERFTQHFRNSVSSIIMKFVDINIRSIEMMKFSEFMRTIPLPSSINVIKMEPLKGYALFVIDASMIFTFIEYFFGGSGGQHVKIEGRQFTDIEHKIIKKIVNVALTDLMNAWGAITSIKAEHISSEINPRFVTIVNPAEVVIKIEIYLEMEGSTGKTFFCIPYTMIEPIKEKLYSGIQADRITADERWITKVTDILMNSFVDVVVEIGSTELTISDLLNLEVGNVIMLSKSASDQLLVKIEESPKFKCLPGYRKGAQAIKITEIV
jgi:flagellar motor switch protein FliM